MNTLQLFARDETGQRTGAFTIADHYTWAETTPVIVDALNLPARITPEEPAVYHLYNDATGEALPPDMSVEETLARAGVFTILVAPEMNPAAGRL